MKIHVTRSLAIMLVVLLTCSYSHQVRAEGFALPEHVKVLPLFVVHSDQPLPNRSQKDRLMRHLKWSQTRFREMLSGRDTFAIAKSTPDVIRINRPLSFYRQIPDGKKASQWVDDFLSHYRLTRFDCPYVFFAIVMNPRDRFPLGGGRPINGGLNRGAGTAGLASYYLDQVPHFQYIMQHELGHAFGLVHPGAYDYDMETNPSIMAYNPAHLTRGFLPSLEPGKLIPEDILSLSLNDRVFTKLEFDPKRDLPDGYSLAKQLGVIGSLEVNGHANYEPTITTESGEANGSSVENVIGREILPDAGPGVTFNPRFMWASENSTTGHISLELEFPTPICLNQIMVHSQHSGKYNKANAIRVEMESSGAFEPVFVGPLTGSDAIVRFRTTEASCWRLWFQAGQSKRVCLRGLQLYLDDTLLFGPRVPYDGTKLVNAVLSKSAPPARAN